MSSLLEELPKIVERGKKTVAQIMTRLESPYRLTLQTSEYVIPAKEQKEQSLLANDPFQKHNDGWRNRQIYGDNLLVMQALLAGDEASGLPSLRGKIDLIYIDPPFDSKADYRTKIKLPHTEISQQPSIIEQFAYADTWLNGTVSYLEMLYPRLALMRELLSEQGSIYVHCDWHAGHYVKVLMDDIFGKENFRNEIVWNYEKWTASSKTYQKNHDIIYFYTKNNEYIFNIQYEITENLKNKYKNGYLIGGGYPPMSRKLSVPSKSV